MSLSPTVYLLHHYPLCPYSRKARLALAEKQLDFTLITHNFWSEKKGILDKNPAGQVPFLVAEKDIIVPDSQIICEYLEDIYPEISLMGKTVANKVEIRRLMALFDQKMAREVSLPLFIEKGIKRFIGSSSPNSNLIRQAKQQARFYLEMIEKLIHERKWLAGQSLSYADLTAAAHLSVVDYLGDVPWDDFEDAKVWYMTLKSRPSFRGLLKDQIPGIKKATHYDQLDF